MLWYQLPVGWLRGNEGIIRLFMITQANESRLALQVSRVESFMISAQVRHKFQPTFLIVLFPLWESPWTFSQIICAALQALGILLKEIGSNERIVL